MEDDIQNYLPNVMFLGHPVPTEKGEISNILSINYVYNLFVYVFTPYGCTL